MPDPRQKIVIHDYGGHHFPGELGRALAMRGYEVLHLYFTQCLNPQAGDPAFHPPGYTRRGLSISSDFKKFSFITRRRQEIEYGRIAAKEIAAYRPDLVISSTTPIDSQTHVQSLCRAEGIPFLYWLQDIVSLAMRQILPRKLPVLGRLIARYYHWQEAGLLRASDAVIVISDQFLPICAAMGVDLRRCHVIENWAPSGEIVPVKRPSAWAREQGLVDKRVILYSGTLGFKHNPVIFEQLCARFKQREEVRIVVITEGIGAAWLRERKATAGLDNLILLPYQPYERLSEVLACGDVVLAILEKEAGIFSVPSKVLSYLCAGRPILLSVPPENLSARIVQRADAGRIAAPDDMEGLLAAAEHMLFNEDDAAAFSANARRYAENTFDIDRICLRFEQIFHSIMPVEAIPSTITAETHPAL